MKVKINHFNLIEIVLTVAVITFGVVIILGMLPKGLRAAKNAGIESFATDVIDQICNYLSYSNSVESALEEFNESEYNDLDNYDTLDYVKLLSGDVEDFKKVNIYGLAPHESKKGVYVIVRGEELAVDKENSTTISEAVVDFSGLLYVWKSKAGHSYLKADHKGGETDKMHDCGSSKGKPVCTFSNEKQEESSRTIQVNMELSYPLSLPYEDRTKRYYSFEVKK